MTLTQDIRFPNPVRNFLDQHMVDLAGLKEAWLAQCAVHPELVDLNDDYDPAVADQYGLAMEWAIGFDLAEVVPYRPELDVLRADGGERAADLVRAAGFIARDHVVSSTTPWTLWIRDRRPSSRPFHESVPLLAACWNVSEISKLLHRPELAEPDGLLAKAHVWTHLWEPPVATPWLSDLWAAYCKFGRSQLDELGRPVEVSVTLVDRYAIADLILGSTLIDIKYTAQPEAKLGEWLLQIVAYALMVPDRQISQIGVYLVRQTRLITWDLAELLPKIDLDEARLAFSALVDDRAPE
ncbi:hypothetical protein [Salininema proteolyticum]|uniref:PD-(D/E)XK endonuclease-like domain-containing protein n=1 Tax=Salininema proteolyticum TaxID=1607685 RepID=A0ABV8TW09_9ACTN